MPPAGQGELRTTAAERAPGAPALPYPVDAKRIPLHSPVGQLGLVFDGEGRLLRIAFEDQEDLSMLADAAAGDEDVARVSTQLAEYFAGERTHFEGIALAPIGTAFQQRVWTLLLQIPYGQTWSYGQLADRLTPKAHARPVGSANGRNPIPIIIPCHRVIGASGELTGFGGGLPRKRWLLSHEGASFIDTPPADRQLPIF